MITRPSNFPDPLKELYELCNAKLTESLSNFREYQTYLKYLRCILERLEEDHELCEFIYIMNGKIIRIMGEKIARGEPAVYEQSKEEIEKQEIWEKIGSVRLGLDTESFFIFSRILLDKVSLLTQYFFQGVQNQPPYYSFTQHRKFFINKKNTPWSPDGCYANYIKNQTGWYEILLQIIRDKFIIHSREKQIPYIRGVTVSPYGNLRAVRDVGTEMSEKTLIMVRDLYQKYKSSIRDLQDIKPDNPRDIIELLSTPQVYSYLQPSDQEIVYQLKQNIGGHLPDIPIVLGHILDFLNFLNSHFIRKLR